MDGGGSHTQSLANLKRELAQETAAARTIDAEADAALADLAHARDAVVVARADQDSATVKKATAARDEAERRASELADKQAAALIRAQRAEQAAQAYETEHARDLIAELEPDATEAVQDLRRHAAEPVAADRRWRDVSAEVSRMLQHVGNTAPHHNARGEHKLTPIIKTLRRAGGIESPMPHWLGERDHQTEQRNRLWRSQRIRKRTRPAEAP